MEKAGFPVQGAVAALAILFGVATSARAACPDDPGCPPSVVLTLTYNLDRNVDVFTGISYRQRIYESSGAGSGSYGYDAGVTVPFHLNGDPLSALGNAYVGVSLDLAASSPEFANSRLDLSGTAFATLPLADIAHGKFDPDYGASFALDDVTHLGILNLRFPLIGLSADTGSGVRHYGLLSELRFQSDTPPAPCAGDPSASCLTFTSETFKVGVFSVPEPSTWALLAVGIGGIGGGLRRARRRSGVP